MLNLLKTKKKGGRVMSLQDKLDEYKKSFLEKAPPEAVAVMQKATEDLKNSGILDKVLKVGEPAPEFSLPDENGNLLELKDLLAQGPVVISFYRGQW
jgi:hypothetical protein